METGIFNLSDEEFAGRVEKVQAAMERDGLDLLIAHSNEADFACVRYLSDYWPIFESAGVLVPRSGEACLLIGPESETYAAGHSRLGKVFKLVEYRESAEPDYPGIKVDNFADIFRAVHGKRPIRKIGLAGYQVFPLPVYEGIRRAAPEAEIAKSGIISQLRIIKSPAELEMLEEAFRIADEALGVTLSEMKPGMTELEVVGIIEKELYGRGAEYEGHPQYVLSGKNSTHAIGRPGYRKLAPGDLVQLNIGARVGGYSSSVGRPVCIGKMSADMRRLVRQGLDLHEKTIEMVSAGVIARDVVSGFTEHARQIGAADNLLYGPCHGLGMMEVEQPWMEAHSDYALAENMTFQVDTFLCGPDYGLRWENGIVVTGGPARRFPGGRMEIIEL